MDHLSGFNLSFASNTASLLSLILSIWAIRIAFKQGEQSRKQSDTAKKLFGEQEELIYRMEGLVSTRSIGAFPTYLPKVAELLSKAETSIRIMTLISSHGSYTAEEKWLQVKHAVEQRGARREKLKSGFVLELITNTPEIFKKTFETIHPVFNEDRNWEDWKRDEEDTHHNRLTHFLQKCKISIRLDDLKVGDYYDARLKEHRDVLDEVFRRSGCDVYECGLSLPLYCYLVDDCRAIFSIPTQDPTGRYAGVGISTEEDGVVIALLRLFEHYKVLSGPPSKS